MITPAFGQTPDQTPQDNPQAGMSEAQNMVPARASLARALDSKNTHTGDQFRATLSSNVHLNNGVVLHRGDALVGKVVTDDMNTPGSSHLAVRFTEVDLKNGQTVPVKATIVALSTPDDSSNGADIQPDHTPSSWSDGTLKVDQQDVVKDVDLHSQVNSQNSGVFVSNRKSNFKIPAGTELALAISAANNAPANPVSSGS